MSAERSPRGRRTRGIAVVTPHARSLRHQYGFGGILLLILLIGGAAGAALFAFSRSDPLPAKQERRVTDALGGAKAALVGYALSRGLAKCSNPGNLTQCAQEEEGRPGELPCPDINNDGLEDKPCSSGPLLGRLPWKTLGIPEPKDFDGETLWYALSGPFRDWDSNPNGASGKRINSDTRGNITVRGASGTDVTTDAVAVIIAPGAPFGTQNRSGTTTALCNLTNVTIARSFCASNYLESITMLTGTSANDGPFIRVNDGARSNVFNDRIVYLTTREIIPQLEMRIGAELKTLLKGYRDNSLCECYPWADTWPYSGGIADIGQNRGRFPSEPFPENWGSGSIPRLPAWVAANDWHNMFYYSVSKQNAAAGCRTCSASEMLRVDNTPVSALFFTPGTPVDGLARLSNSSRRDNLTLYLADAANNDGGNTTLCPDVGEIGGDAESGMRPGQLVCDNYTKPASTAFDRNRLWMVGVAPPGTCAAAAQAILDAAPCGVGYAGQSVNPICSSARETLDACPCKSAAKAMVEVPCRNTNSADPHCAAPVATLQQCGT
jgi:hypothetical protein